MSHDKLCRDLNFSRQDTPSFLEGSWWDHALMAKANSVRLQKKNHKLFIGLWADWVWVLISFLDLICSILLPSWPLHPFLFSSLALRPHCSSPSSERGWSSNTSPEHQQWSESCQDTPRIQESKIFETFWRPERSLTPSRHVYTYLHMLSSFNVFFPHPLANSSRFYHVFSAIQRRWLRKVLLRAWLAKNQAPEWLTVWNWEVTNPSKRMFPHDSYVIIWMRKLTSSCRFGRDFLHWRQTTSSQHYETTTCINRLITNYNYSISETDSSDIVTSCLRGRATVLPWHSPAPWHFSEVLVGAAPPLRSGAVQCWQRPRKTSWHFVRL